MAFLFGNDYPSQLYLQGLDSLLLSGEEFSPRGKKIKEIRPAIFEFTKPTRRVTFVKGRVINPFFQLAEALWILAGRADVKWLTDYNQSIAQFSDDGQHFNAPYGERLRYWNMNSLNNFVFNPCDQLVDVYEKIKKDTETRQAVAIIYNPLFDGNFVETKDRPCNLVLTFKVRSGKLHLTVFNRSNDLHWGLFGANLVQFSTILEVMAGWLGLEIGTYTQITDSLHIYLDDYGSKCTDDIMKANDNCMPFYVSDVSYQLDKYYDDFFVEPAIDLNMPQFNAEMGFIFRNIDPLLRSDKTYSDHSETVELIRIIESLTSKYLKMTVYAMAAYQAHRRGKGDQIYKMLWNMGNKSSWQVSCLRFLSGKGYDLRLLYEDFPQDIIDYIERKDIKE